MTVSAWFRGSGIARQQSATWSPRARTSARPRPTASTRAPTAGMAFYVSGARGQQLDALPRGADDRLGRPVAQRRRHVGRQRRPASSSTARRSATAHPAPTPPRVRHPERQHDARRLRRHLRPRPDRRPRRGVDLVQGAPGRPTSGSARRCSSRRTEHDKLALTTGAVAQLGERLAGSQKVRGSSPLSSIWQYRGRPQGRPRFVSGLDRPAAGPRPRAARGGSSRGPRA